MAFYPISLLPPQFSNPSNGENASGFILQARIAGTTTLTDFYSDDSGTSVGSSITLDSGGFTAVSGNVFVPYLDDSITYKFTLTDPDTLIQFTVDDITDVSIARTITTVGSVGSYVFATATTMSTLTTVGGITITPVLGMALSTLGFTSVNDGGQSDYVVTNDTANGYDKINLGGGFTATLLVKNGWVDAAQCGAVYDGTTNSRDALEAAAEIANVIVSGPLAVATSVTLDNEFKGVIGQGYLVVDAAATVTTTNNEHVYAEWFGATPDYNYSTTSGTDNAPAIQAALRTGTNVKIGVGSFGLSDTLEMLAQQCLSGVGSPQRGARERPSVTELIWMADVHGISTEDNNANGACIENLTMRCDYQQTNFTSTKQGLHFGTEGGAGGASQQIKVQVKNVLTYDWLDGAGVHGFGYETVFHNVLHNGFIERGFAITDQSNIVTMYDCGGLNSQVQGGSSKALVVSEAHQVTAHTFRAENNRVGIEVIEGGSCLITNAYCEGNRIIDFVVDDDNSQLVIHSFRVFHENEGATTASIFQVNSGATDGATLVARDGFIKVTKGNPGGDNDLTQMFLNNGSGTTSYFEFTNIDWQGVGNIFAGSGKGPDKMTFRQLPWVEFVGRGEGSSATIAIGRTVSGGSPADSMLTLTNFDGTTQVVGKNPGARIYRMDTTTVDFYHWSGSTWTASNK